MKRPLEERVQRLETEVALLKNKTHKITDIDKCNEIIDRIHPEPLIKDEKIRKAVRAWADANDIELVWHEYSSCWLRGNGLKIELENEVVELEQGNYDISDLCGEEE